jgi:hypothetical protein
VKCNCLDVLVMTAPEVIWDSMMGFNTLKMRLIPSWCESTLEMSSFYYNGCSKRQFVILFFEFGRK